MDKPFQAILAYTLASGFGVANITNAMLGQKDLGQLVANPVNHALESSTNIASVELFNLLTD